jgi:cyclophilin family peptidyl-prolyl cis-trans isomerase
VARGPTPFEVVDVSKKHHKKQVERARSKRRASALDRRQRRVRFIALALAFALALSVFAVALMERGGSPTIEDEGEPGAADVEDLDDEAADEGAEAAADAEACPPADDAPEPEAVEYPSEPEMEIDEDATYVATLDTTCGDIILELDPAGAPRTVNSFVFLARDGYFEGVPFHRVVPGFVIQGGDPTGTGTGGPGYTFDDELSSAEQLVAEEGGYPRGKLVMANAGPDTNGSQFFITLEDLDGESGTLLPPQYALFGEVIEGMEVVDRIASEPTEGELAVDPVRIRSVAIDES